MALETKILNSVGHNVKIMWIQENVTCAITGRLQRVDLGRSDPEDMESPRTTRYLTVEHPYAYIALDDVISIEPAYLS